MEEEVSSNEGSRSRSPDSPEIEGPRKRQRLSPDSVSEEPSVSAQVFSAPSRIRARGAKVQAVPPDAKEDGTELDGSELPSRLLAPTDASTRFDDIGVSPWLVKSLANVAIKRPTAVQKLCIPEILKGRNCIGSSRTGSGKTCAFAVPILQKWQEDPSATFALVLTPTRELALQLLESFLAISSSQLKAVLITGGADIRQQAIALAKRPHIVIGTPGRLADHIRSSGEDSICGLRRVKFAVLDEADRLLAANGPGSMLPDVEECLSVLPPASERQTLLFTATMTPEVRALKEMPPQPGKDSAFVCEVGTQDLAVPTTLQQTYLQVPVTYREHYLHELLVTNGNEERSVIIFCNRAATANYIYHLLRLLGHRATALYAQLKQRDRIDNLGRFRAQAARILVATDVAARGLDIPEVALVINYDVPREPDDYIHRVGRTARAGRKGTAITFVGQRDVSLVLAIEERVGKQMDSWTEDGVNLETRVVRPESLKLVSEKRREALLDIEEGREAGTGKRRREKVNLKKQS
jgi:ATP-dependent RNA helicase DDX49/DBP8